MIEKRKQELVKELKYLTEEAKNKELELNINFLENESVDIKQLAKEIYLRRGLNINAIKTGFFESITNEITKFANVFKGKEKTVRNKMILEIVYMIILIILLKIPIDLVRDIGLDYVRLITTNTLYYTLLNILFLLIYTIVAISTLIVLIRNFNKKYSN